MESYELNACVDRLNTLKKDAQRTQKKGLPFIMASVVIWGLIFIAPFFIAYFPGEKKYIFPAVLNLTPITFVINSP